MNIQWQMTLSSPRQAQLHIAATCTAFPHWSSWADRLQISFEASWGGSLRKLWTLYFNTFSFVPKCFLICFRTIFKYCLLWSLWPDWLQISCDASWVRSILKWWKLCGLSIFCIFSFIFQPHFLKLSPLKFLGRLTSYFMWGILGRDYAQAAIF